jgi:hypothetical protein
MSNMLIGFFTLHITHQHITHSRRRLEVHISNVTYTGLGLTPDRHCDPLQVGPAWKHPRHKISCVVSGMDIGIRHLSTIGHITISNVFETSPRSTYIQCNLYRVGTNPGSPLRSTPGGGASTLHWIYVLLGDVSNE